MTEATVIADTMDISHSALLMLFSEKGCNHDARFKSQRHQVIPHICLVS